MRSQFYTRHDSSAIVADVKLWPHVFNIMIYQVKGFFTWLDYELKKTLWSESMNFYVAVSACRYPAPNFAGRALFKMIDEIPLDITILESSDIYLHQLEWFISLPRMIYETLIRSRLIIQVLGEIYIKNIRPFYHFLTLIWHRIMLLKYFFIGYKDPFIPPGRYRSCRCPDSGLFY